MIKIIYETGHKVVVGSLAEAEEILGGLYQAALVAVAHDERGQVVGAVYRNEANVLSWYCVATAPR